MADDPKGPSSSRFHRFRKLASLSARVGTDVVSKGVKRFAGQEPTDILSLATAEKLVATLGDLKGAAMKMGQVLSMDPELLPPELRAVLGRLQNEAPPMPYENVVEMVEEELGAPPDKVFQEFEKVPFAAASVGQVHRAVVDGRKVAVKVQYPGMDKVLKADLDSMGTLVKAMSLTSKSLDGRAYFTEIREQLLLESDYQREAQLAREFRHAVRDYPELAVPEVFDEYCARRVLTLEYLEGPTLRHFVESNPSNDERMRISRLLSRAIYLPFVLEGLVHADPHPGNFLVMADGRLAVLDFGAIKRFSLEFTRTHLDMFIHALNLDPQGLVKQCRDLGFEVGVNDEEAAKLLMEIMDVATRPLQTETFDFAQAQLSKEMRNLMTSRLTTVMKIRPPAEGVMFARATGGLAQNLKLLGGHGNFRKNYDEVREIAIDTAKKFAKAGA